MGAIGNSAAATVRATFPAAQTGERFRELVHFGCGGLGPRQTEQQVRSLFIGSRLRSGQGYVPGNQAPFKMSKRIFVGVGGQRSLSSH